MSEFYGDNLDRPMTQKGFVLTDWVRKLTDHLEDLVNYERSLEHTLADLRRRDELIVKGGGGTLRRASTSCSGCRRAVAAGAVPLSSFATWRLITSSPRTPAARTTSTTCNSSAPTATGSRATGPRNT